MKKFTFRGGVHPYDGKELTENEPVRTLEPGRELAFLLTQHIGAPAFPVVKEGDKVKKGDIIASAPEGTLGADVHASIDGKIESVTSKYIKIVR